MGHRMSRFADHQYFRKQSSLNLPKRLNLAEDAPIIGIEALEDQRIDLGIVHVDQQ